jgi:hypothetical protein
MIRIDGLEEALARLGRLDPDAAARAGLRAAAEALAADVRARLATKPGGPHEAPWLRRGALRGSVAVTETDTGAVLASTSPVAVFQELGTTRTPPRPFLAPAAAAAPVAQAVAAAIATHASSEAPA